MTEQERYIERVRNAYERFLISKFIEYKPYSINDDCIIADAKDRSIVNYNGGRLSWMHSFSSILTISGEANMEYNGNYFKQLILKSSDGQSRRINFSDFLYYNSFYTGKEDFSRFGYDYNASDAECINLLDDMLIDPDELARNIGGEILMGYSFDTVNRFRRIRKCYRLYSLNGNKAIDAGIIRSQILRSQAFALLLAANYPVLCLPTYNGKRIYPYMYEITKEVGSQYTTRIRTKLHEIEQTLREHGLTYEYNI